MKKIKRTTLTNYWTSRYVLTICVGLSIIGIISVLWIRHTTLENRLNISIVLAEGIADRLGDHNTDSKNSNNQNNQNRLILKENMPGLATAKKTIKIIGHNPEIYIVAPNGNVLNQVKQIGYSVNFQYIPLDFLQSENQVQKMKVDNSTDQYYLVKAPIKKNSIVTGWVVVIQTNQDLIKLNRDYSQLAMMLISLGLLGWGAVYLLSRKLSKPIKDVAQAAKQIRAGNYSINLSKSYKEQEVHELVTSFKEMTSRLQQLESIRTELLASVTHELKTPVTSISGLLQAINAEVVTDEEAKEFIAISLKETTRLQKMVADLLEFNAFAADAIPVKIEKCWINEQIQELTHQWVILQENTQIKFAINLLTPDRLVQIDPIRLQQILENLLNNARQAMDYSGCVTLSLFYKKESNQVEVAIKDSGIGIPFAEQDLIFERFYRGENKKYKVRGLGIGLPFSKVMAKSMGGELLLKESIASGTTFTIVLPALDDGNEVIWKKTSAMQNKKSKK